MLLINSCMCFIDPSTTEIYSLSLHDALPISSYVLPADTWTHVAATYDGTNTVIYINGVSDRKSTRLNSSHGYKSYAVFCLNKKNNQEKH